MQIKNNLCIIPATVNEAYFARILFVPNKEKVNVGDISMNEWKEILAKESTEVKHFLICKGAVPISYMRIVKEKTKISMFLVADDFDYGEIHKFGVDFANNYVW